MGHRYDELTTGEIYHVFTRGVEKRHTFLNDYDRQRFLDLLIYCLPLTPQISFSRRNRLKQQLSLTKPGVGLVDIYCYCLMPNHLHLLLHQNHDQGIPTFMKRLLTSYSCYFNTKYERSGSLFIHPYKAVLINNDSQLLHTFRYIHLNPYVARLVNDIFAYPWSSLCDFLKPPRPTGCKYCHTEFITQIIKPVEYQKFITDQADYSRTLKDNEDVFIDNEG